MRSRAPGGYWAIVRSFKSDDNITLSAESVLTEGTDIDVGRHPAPTGRRV
jgi:hypothetical protein